MNALATVPRERIAAFCRTHDIRRLSLFGSVIREDFSDSSDIDVLVDFSPDARIGFFKLHTIEAELSALMNGRRVDLVTEASLSPFIRDQVLAEAQVTYEQA